MVRAIGISLKYREEEADVSVSMRKKKLIL